MRTNHFFSRAIFLLAACSFASCINDKYDLDNVDMTIGTTGDLTLPTSSTGSILLKNLLDLEDDGVIQPVNGKYYFVEEGNADVPTIDITPITISKPSLSSIKTSVDIDINDGTLARTSTAGANKAYPLPGNYTYTIVAKNKALFTLDDKVTANVPKEVTGLNYASFADNTTLDCKLLVYFDDGYEFINKVHLDNIVVTLPKGLFVSTAELVHWTYDGQKEVYETIHAKQIDNENGKIYLTEKDANTLIDSRHDIHLRLTFDQAITGYGGFVFEDNKVSLKGNFAIDGSFRIETNDFDLSKLTDEQKLKLLMTQNFDAICPQKVEFEGSASFQNDISINEFSGKVCASVSNIAPIQLNDLPDFLNDPEVVLDLANPAFFVKIDFPLPADAQTKIKLTANYTDGTPSLAKETSDIVIPADKNVVFCVADRFEGLEIPADYDGMEIINVQIPKLGDLLKHIPDEILVEVNDIAMDIESMPIPSRYDIDVDYKIYTPLEFGEDFQMVYQGTEEGIAEDMKDISKVDVKGLRLDAVAETNLPLNLKLSLDIMDAKGQSIKNSFVSVSDIVIGVHSGTGDVSLQPFFFEIKPMSGHTIQEALEVMDKFHYRAVADAENGGVLSEDAYLKLKDIKITLLGGITYDAN